MRIGIYSPYLDTVSGGEKYMLSIAQCLSTEHEVDIFWNEDDFTKKAQEKLGLNLEKVKVTPNVFASKTNFFARLLNTKIYDVIFFLSDGSVPFILAKKNIVHFQFPVEWVNGKTLPTKLKFLKISTVICNSYFTKSYIDKTFGIKSLVVYPPVDVSNVKETKKENIILHVGRFSGNTIEGKNFKKQDVLIDAFKEMVKDGLKKWKFVLVTSMFESDKEKFELLKKTAEGYPIEFVINQNNDTLWEYYNKAKIYWHATGFGEDIEHHPELAEHFGISTCEAMGASVVPVVINLGGQKEIVTDGENGFLWDDIEELKNKTFQLIKDEKLQNDLSKNAKRSVEKFSFKNFCKNINSLIS